MKKSAMIIAAAATCLWMPIGSISAAAKNDQKKAEAPDDDNTIRCRKIEVTGSLVRKTKVCHTVAEWREISAKGNRATRDLLESGNVCTGGPTCGGGL